MIKKTSKIFVNQTIERKYRALLHAVKTSMQPELQKDIRKTFQLISQSGANEDTLLYGQSALDFSLDMALIATEELGLGRPAILASILYNYVPSGKVTLEQIRSVFDEQITVIVSELAQISAININAPVHQAENFRNMLLSMITNINVIMIKLVERLKLMRMLKQLPAEAQNQFAKDSFYLFAPLAHRLGLYNIKSELEDLSFKQIEPTAYDTINRKLDKTASERDLFIKQFTKPLQDELSQQGFDFSIKARLKSVYSIHNKMVKQQVDFEEVYDLFAIRIIINSPPEKEKSECWQVYSIVTDYYQPNPLRMRDWISSPKTNGYESLHTTVVAPDARWVEVQIRSARMDEIAEKGLAAHWKYKGGESDENIQKTLERIRESIEATDTESIECLNNMKLNLYSKEIFVFTPKGDLRKLPVGATVLDFAFEIHSGVGATCVGAKVNGKNVPIRQILQNGDKVEINTFKNQKPSIDWLSFVVTSKARNRIKSLIKDEERKQSEFGREILMRRFKNWKMTFDDNVLKIIQNMYGLKTITEVYTSAANEKLDFHALKEQILNKEDKQKTVEKIDEQIAIKSKCIKREEGMGKDCVAIDSKIGEWDYKLAKCCNPVYGDPIFAFVTISDGVKLHHKNCPNAQQMIDRFGYRILKAEWITTEQSSLYHADLLIKGYDEIGVLNRLTDVISKELKTPIRALSLNTNEEIFEGKISLLVKNTGSLEVLINKLKKLKGIISVIRMA